MIRGHSLNPKDFDKYITCGIYVLRELEDNSVEQVTDADIMEAGLYNLVHGAYWSKFRANKLTNEEFNSLIIVPYMYYEGPTKNGGIARWKCSTVKLKQELRKSLLIWSDDNVISDSCKDWIINIIKSLYKEHRKIHNNIGDMGFIEFCLNLCCGYNQLFEDPYYIRSVEKSRFEKYDYIVDSDIAMLNSIDMKNSLKE